MYKLLYRHGHKRCHYNSLELKNRPLENTETKVSTHLALQEELPLTAPDFDSKALEVALQNLDVMPWLQ